MATTISEIEAVARKLEGMVKDFEKKDRRSLLRAASAPVRKSARNKTKRGKRPHYRYDGARRIKYNPGNLRRSMKTLIFRQSPDVFVGPKFGGTLGAVEYGKPGQPVDGYYYAMAYGSANNFKRLVLDAAAQEAGDEAVKSIKEKARQRFKDRAKKRGLSTI